MRIASTLMKLTAAATTLVLAACAGTGGSGIAGVRAPAAKVDQQRVAYVEAVADQHNVEVHWVNPPRITEED